MKDHLKGFIKSRLISLLTGLVMLAAVIAIPAVGPIRQAHAAPSLANGDLVHQTNFSTACASGIGVGIGFDGTSLWYSCYASNPDLYKADPLTGNVLASYNIAGGLGALAWDGTRKKMWAGWGGGAGSSGDIRLIDTTTGTATVVFNATAAAFDELDDGLAYDAQDDSLYVSPDTSTQIYRYTSSGSVIGQFAWNGNGCYNSGLAIGGSLLFEGSDGCNHVWVVNKSDHSAAFNFNTGAGGVRDEDLECDSVSFAPTTVMWSMEAYEPRRAIAFAIPSGSCGTGGGVDSDGDGLLDEWETNGVWIQPNGTGTPVFIDLPAMGADPKKPDIFLQTDWMQDATHNMQLQSTAIKKIVDSFATSPYTSPTGSVGINLHVDNGPSSTLNFTTGTTWGTLSKAQSIPWTSVLGTFSGGNYDWTAFQTIKDANFTPTGRVPIFHYVIVANNYSPNGSSGISRGIGASDLIVSLGSFTGGTGSINEQAGTLMHELGHNLGLQHGGGDGVNFKPNYLSIMNYAFQLQGLTIGAASGNFDYSRSAVGNLNETSLNEPTGLSGAPANYGTRHWCPGVGYVSVTNASGPIDWNCNGNTTETGVSFDINNDSTQNTLTGFNDWANLKLKGGAIGLAGVAPNLPMLTEDDPLTVALAKQILPAQVQVPVDIKPGICPNNLSKTGDQTLHVSILGTAAYPVSLVDPNSIKLEGASPLQVPKPQVQDVATPFVPFVGKKNSTDCTTAGPDGFPDLNLAFRKGDIAALQGSVQKGQVLVLHLTGKLKDGTPIVGEDVVVIVN